MIGCVYKITVGELGIYIGSAKDFNERLKTHNEVAETSNIKLYKAIRENGGKFVMTKLHDFEYENDVELRIEERRVYDSLSPNLNTYRPHITEEELKEHKKEYQRQYRIENPDKIKEQQKQYRIHNKEQLKQYAIDNKEHKKEYQKQYNIDNADKIKEQQRLYKIKNKEHQKEYTRQYRIENTDKIKERQKQYKMDNREQINKKITCVCGCEINKGNLPKHKKTQKHINMMIGK